MALLLLLQAVAGPPAPARPIDLRAAVAKPCPKPVDDAEVVVCGHTAESPRLVKLPERARRSPEEAMTFRLPGGGTGNLHAIQTQLPGAIGQGAAVTLRLPFGRRKKPD